MIGKVDLAKLSNSSSSITKEILRFSKTTYTTMWQTVQSPEIYQCKIGLQFVIFGGNSLVCRTL